MPVPITPVIHTQNITGSPATTIAGIAAGISTYFVGAGDTFPPHDTQGWISFALGLLMAIAGAFLKTPGKA